MDSYSSRHETSQPGVDSEDPEDTQHCCGIRGQRFMCLPYNDATVVTSQVTAIIAMFFSWASFHTIFMSLIGLILSQLLWCCRQSRFAMYFFVLAMGVSFLTSLVIGVLAITVLPTYRYCDSWTMRSSDYYGDSCDDVLVASLAFVSSFFWAVSTGFLCYFVVSGRHAKWEELQANKADRTGPPPIVQLVEMGSDDAPPTEASPEEEGADTS